MGGGNGEGMGRAAPTAEASPDLSFCGFVLLRAFKQASQQNVGGKTSLWRLVGIKVTSSGCSNPALFLPGSPSVLIPLGEIEAKGTPPCLTHAVTFSSLSGW